VHIALTYIHGIGRDSARKICEAVGITEQRRVNDLTDADLTAIYEYLKAIPHAEPGPEYPPRTGPLHSGN
jgi:ribosomal protein S13